MVYISNKKKPTFHPHCFNIKFAEETINGGHITITTAKLRLCTNYTPDLCNVFCNLLGSKLKKWFELLWKGTMRMLHYLSRHSKILFPQKPIVWYVGWIDKVYSRCTIWCTIFLLKPFEVHVCPRCTRAPKVLTRHTKNRAPEFQILSAR